MENADTVSKAELYNLTCSWFFTYVSSPPPPHPSGCISVFVTLTLCCHHCPNTHLFIYLRVRGERTGGGIF